MFKWEKSLVLFCTTNKPNQIKPNHTNENKKQKKKQYFKLYYILIIALLLLLMLLISKFMKRDALKANSNANAYWIHLFVGIVISRLIYINIQVYRIYFDAVFQTIQTDQMRWSIIDGLQFMYLQSEFIFN